MSAKRRGGPGGLNKVCGVSPELQTIVGEPALPRTEVVISRFMTILFSLLGSFITDITEVLMFME